MSQIQNLIYIIEDDQIMAECIARAALTAISDYPRHNESDPLPAQLTTISSANTSMHPSTRPAAHLAISAPPSIETSDDFSMNATTLRSTTNTIYQSNGVFSDQPGALSAKLPASGQEAISLPEDSTKNDQSSFYTKKQHNASAGKFSKTDQQSFFSKIPEITPVKNNHKTDQQSFYNKISRTLPKKHFDKTDQQSFPPSNIRIFNDAISAMDAINGELPDLILLDVLLSGPNGFTLLNELASYSDTADIPIIIISSLDLCQRDLEIYGVVNVLNKSTMTPHAIQEAIRYAL